MLDLKFLIFIATVISYFSYVLANDGFADGLRINRHHLMQVFEMRLTVDEKLCELQKNLTKHKITFLDSSAKIPSGILLGNLNDFGQYKQCISHNETTEGVNILGKYCMMHIHFEIEENVTLPAETMLFKIIPITGLFGLCVPDACSVADINETVLPGFTITGEEIYCRHINDKPMSVQDVVAIFVFSILGFLVIVSSAFELCRKFLYNKDTPRILKSFSVYHNVNMLTRIKKSVNPLSCVYGMRVLSMTYIILGHTYFTKLGFASANPTDVLKFINTYHVTWIEAAILSVDTFFYLVGFLLTWTILQKFNNSVVFLKSVPFLYLNRYLRLTPLIVAVMLLQVSYLYHVGDGPDWRMVSVARDVCLERWWLNLLYVQNYINHEDICLNHTWYLAVDMQLYVFAPFVIYFLLSGKKRATLIITVVVCGALGAPLAYAYNYKYNMTVAEVLSSLIQMRHLYLNTLNRAPPFILGIAVAYIMSVLRKREVKISNKFYKTVHWMASFALIILPVHGLYSTSHYKMSQHNINFFNAWHRSSWALGVGGIIFACANGFGGPVQWFLGLRMWTVPARLSYALYLIHYPIMGSILASNTAPIRFDELQFLFESAAYLVSTFLAAFILHLAVEAPFNELSNLLFAKIAGKIMKDDTTIVSKNEFQPPSLIFEVKQDIVDFKNGQESKKENLNTATSWKEDSSNN